MMPVNQKGGQFVTKGHCYSKTYEKSAAVLNVKHMGTNDRFKSLISPHKHFRPGTKPFWVGVIFFVPQAPNGFMK